MRPVRSTLVVIAAVVAAACGGSSPLTGPTASLPTGNPAATAKTAGVSGTATIGQFRIHPNPDTDGILKVSVGDGVVINAEDLAAKPPAPQTYLIVNWGDGGNERIGCGPCRLTHAYQKSGRFTLTMTTDDLQAAGQGQARAATNTTASLVVDVIGRSGLDFSASPARMVPGGSSTLSWNVPDAATVDIAGVGKNLPPNGSATVSPANTTIYKLVSHGPGGATGTSASTTVIVSLLSQFEFDPSVLSVGDTTNLVIGLSPDTLFAGFGDVTCLLNNLAPTGPPTFTFPTIVFPFQAIASGTCKVSVIAEDFDGHITQDTITLTIH